MKVNISQSKSLESCPSKSFEQIVQYVQTGALNLEIK